MDELSNKPRVVVGVKHTCLHPVPQIRHRASHLQYFGLSAVDRRAVGLGLSLGSVIGASVTAVSVGPPEARETLKEVLTLGVDDAVLFEHPPDQSPTLQGVVRSIGLASQNLHAHFVVVGDYSSDEGSGAVGRSLAILLPSMGYVPRISALLPKDGALEVRFDLDTRTLGHTVITSQAIMTTSNTPLESPKPSLSRRASLSLDPNAITTLDYSEGSTASTTLSQNFTPPRIPPQVPQAPQGDGALLRLQSILGGAHGLRDGLQVDQRTYGDGESSPLNSVSCAEEILRLLTTWGVISTV